MAALDSLAAGELRLRPAGDLEAQLVQQHCGKLPDGQLRGSFKRRTGRLRAESEYYSLLPTASPLAPALGSPQNSELGMKSVGGGGGGGVELLRLPAQLALDVKALVQQPALVDAAGGAGGHILQPAPQSEGSSGARRQLGGAGGGSGVAAAATPPGSQASASSQEELLRKLGSGMRLGLTPQVRAQWQQLMGDVELLQHAKVHYAALLHMWALG